MLSIISMSLIFCLISIFLPGFKVSGSKLNYVWLSIGYFVLSWGISILIFPFTAVIGFFLAIIKIIPLIGPLIAGAGGLVSAFILTFTSTFILLIALDAIMDSFYMKSKWVALNASIILAVVRLFLSV